jgi:hypothetical protein
VPGWPVWLRVVAALPGAAAFVAGVVALFATDNGAAATFLLTVGVVGMLAAALAGRIEIESFGLLGAQVKVRQVVKRRLELADTGGTAAGDDLRKQALVLQRLNTLYGLYAHIRRTEPFSGQRTRKLDDLARRMQAVGKEAAFDPAEVASWFHEGTDPLRVIAINLMIARPEYRDVLVVLATIEAPRSNFEQYWGLWLARDMAGNLEAVERGVLVTAIERARSRRRFRKDKPLMAMSAGVLAKLGAG